MKEPIAKQDLASETLWEFTIPYQKIPIFTLQLFDDMPDSQPPSLEISGSKELNKEALEARLSALARYDLYDHMDMNCNAGFGNSVTLRLYGKR